MRIKAKFLSILLVTAVLAACATPAPYKAYSGAERPLAELALVEIPDTIEVMAIDGRDVSGNFLRKNNRMVLLPGEHVFSVRYVDLFQVTADEHEVIRSRQAALRFKAESGVPYQLQVPLQKNVTEAKEFAKSPSFSVVSLPHKKVVAESIAITSYAEASLLDAINQSFRSRDEGEKKSSPQRVDLLKQIWLQSNEEERLDFQQWLKSQAVSKGDVP